MTFLIDFELDMSEHIGKHDIGIHNIHHISVVITEHEMVTLDCTVLIVQQLQIVGWSFLGYR